MMLCGGAAILLLERPAETDGRFTNAGRAKRAGLAAAHLQEIFFSFVFFFFTPPTPSLPPVTVGFLSSSKFGAAAPLLRCQSEPEEDNVATSALSVSRVAKAQFYISSTPVAINRRLFYSLDFANTFVHAAVGGGWG